MRISVRFFTSLREITGRKEEIFDFPGNEKITLERVLEALSSHYGKKFVDYVYDSEKHDVKGFLQFLINGISASTMNGFQTELKDCDVLAIIPPVGGG